MFTPLRNFGTNCLRVPSSGRERCTLRLFPSSKNSYNKPVLHPSKHKNIDSQCLAGENHMMLGNSSIKTMRGAEKAIYLTKSFLGLPHSKVSNSSRITSVGKVHLFLYRIVWYIPRRAYLTADGSDKIGKQVSHGTAKEMLIGLAAAEAEKLIEKKGLSTHEGEGAKHAARRNAERMYDEHYGDDDQYNPSSHGPPGLLEQYGGHGRGYCDSRRHEYDDY